MEKERCYMAIDLKSFYASVECMERGLDPLTTNLVVADESRTEKTICLAVSPSLKSFGIPGRPRLFEVIQKVGEVNAARLCASPSHCLSGKSFYYEELIKHPGLAVDYIVAPPQMSRYMQVSRKIFSIYLKYVSAADMHVYSIDEVFMDVTDYLGMYRKTAPQLCMEIIHDVLDSTGITATAGIGSNMYLCKIAMDIEAKHAPADKDGVRMAELTEKSYREKLWAHRPLTDFWRIGQGYAKKLNSRGIYTMGDIARCSLGKPSDYYNEELLYKLFGINAELLIDHAWGWEPCTIADIKSYRTKSKSLTQGQVLTKPTPYDEAKLIIKEMADLLSMDLVRKSFVTGQIVLTVGYDISGSQSTAAKEIVSDRYGRAVPKQAHGSFNLEMLSCASSVIRNAAERLFENITDPRLMVRRMYIVASNIVSSEAINKPKEEQLSLFSINACNEKNSTVSIKAPGCKPDKAAKPYASDEIQLQKTMLDIKNKYGKNAILRGMDFQEGATAKQRNSQIGGHRA